MTTEKDRTLSLSPAEESRVASDRSDPALNANAPMVDELISEALDQTYVEPEPPAQLYDALAQLLNFFEDIASEIDADSNSEH